MPTKFLEDVILLTDLRVNPSKVVNHAKNTPQTLNIIRVWRNEHMLKLLSKFPSLHLARHQFL